jgi:hypothetical protein
MVSRDRRTDSPAPACQPSPKPSWGRTGLSQFKVTRLEKVPVRGQDHHFSLTGPSSTHKEGPGNPGPRAGCLGIVGNVVSRPAGNQSGRMCDRTECQISKGLWVTGPDSSSAGDHGYYSQSLG